MPKKSKEVSLVKAYKDCFDSAGGKKILSDLMKRFRMLNASLAADTNKVIYGEGQRSVVLHILSMRDTDLKALELLIQDADNEE